MQYLIAEESFLLKLSDAYLEKIEQDQSNCFLKYYKRRKNYSLSKVECDELDRLLYISEEKPFGKIDDNFKMAKIETHQQTIDKFNHFLASSLEQVFKIDDFKKHCESLIRCFIPLSPIEGKRLRENGSGSSVHWFKGAIFLSLPVDSLYAHLEFTLNIVHELGHQSLMIYQDCDEVIVNGLQTEVYSSIRKTSRPALMSFHALVAVYYMLKLFEKKKTNQFWLSLSEQDRTYLQSREIDLRNSFVQGAEALKNVEWTVLGKKIYLEMINFYLHQYGA